MQDIITRDITVTAKKEDVYNAIADPSQITKWFPEQVLEGTLSVGERPVFVFMDGAHKTQIYVEAATPHEYFAYRWVPGENGMIGDVLTVANTLVEFFLEETDGQTKVTVKESGFASLPRDVAQAKFDQNSGGWTFMMGRLEKVFETK